MIYKLLNIRRAFATYAVIFGSKDRCTFSKFPRVRKYSDVSSSDSDHDVFNRVVELLKDAQTKYILFLVGAGISTSSGIPDFRSPGAGLFDNLTDYNLPRPEAVFELDYFYSNPQPFYSLAKELYPSGKYKPNIAHYFMRYLHQASRVLRVYTQNIDSLERMAGIPLDKLVEAHGTFLTSTCVVCGTKAQTSLFETAVMRGQIVNCQECNELVKPDIVFFGENLPERFWKYPDDLAQTDMVFIIGTSLEVYPFARIADDVPNAVPRVLVNRELVGSFNYRKRSNDLILHGNISEVIAALVNSLTWNNEVQTLMDQPLVEI